MRRRKKREGIAGKYWEKENLRLVTWKTTEKEKDENILRREKIFCREKKNVDGKEGKYW